MRYQCVLPLLFLLAACGPPKPMPAAYMQPMSGIFLADQYEGPLREQIGVGEVRIPQGIVISPAMPLTVEAFRQAVVLALRDGGLWGGDGKTAYTLTAELLSIEGDFDMHWWGGVDLEHKASVRYRLVDVAGNVHMEEVVTIPYVNEATWANRNDHTRGIAVVALTLRENLTHMVRLLYQLPSS